MFAKKIGLYSFRPKTPVTGIGKTERNYIPFLLFNGSNWFDGESNKPTDDILSLFTIDEFGK